MHCKACGGHLISSDSGIPSDLPSCKCVLQFIPLGNDTATQLVGDSGIIRRKHDCHESASKPNLALDWTLASNCRRDVSKIPRLFASSSPTNSRPAISHPHQMNANAIFNRMSRPPSEFTESRPPSDVRVNLQEIRDEISSLRQKFDDEVKEMRKAIAANVPQMTESLNKPKVAEPGAKIGGKENAMPQSRSILSSAYRAFLDAVRHRQAFETDFANSERSQAQKNVFNILGHLNNNDADVIRMRALLDDVVNNADIIPKPPPSRPKLQQMPLRATPSRFDRLSAPKKQFNLTTTKRPSKPPTNKRPTSLPLSFKAAPRSTGLTDLVNFSSKESTTTAPLMRRPRVVLKYPPQCQEGGEKSVRFTIPQTKSNAPETPLELKSKLPVKFVPLGMRQYTMWPSEKPYVSMAIPIERHPKQGDTLTIEIIRNMLETALNQHLERQASQLQVRDRDVETCRQNFTKDKALSPFPSPQKPELIDATSSPHLPRIISRRESDQSIYHRRRSSSVPSASSEFVPISERPKSARSEPQSPIFSPLEEVPSFFATEMENGLSLTDQRSFSDGVWLDPDRSEGEYGGIPIQKIEQAAKFSTKLGPLPSLSESVSQFGEEKGETQSDGEFTLDQVTNQPGGWIAPWRDALLHCIALNTGGETSKLPWKQLQEVEKVATLLDSQNEVLPEYEEQLERSHAEELSWVKRIAEARRVRRQAETPTLKGANKSDGEVSIPSSVKELRRAILARSSQRMRQKESSVSSGENEDDTLQDTKTIMERTDSEASLSKDFHSGEISDDDLSVSSNSDAGSAPPKESTVNLIVK